MQTKQCTNRSIHWTHQYAILDKVQDTTLEKQSFQKHVDDIQLIELLPNKNVQAILLQNWAVLASRIITKYLPSMQFMNDVVVRHLPHKYSEEMSKKSHTVSFHDGLILS